MVVLSEADRDRGIQEERVRIREHRPGHEADGLLGSLGASLTVATMLISASPPDV
jgi:hypothetical protein